jgi:hypothetical protein
MDKGISLILIPQPTCPAALVSATHIAFDFLHSAVLRNVGERPLIGFRLGWVARFPSRKPELHLCPPVNLPEAIGHSKTCAVPAQVASPDDVKQGAIQMAFFVAEAFLVGEKPWKADLAEIDDHVRRGRFAEN